MLQLVSSAIAFRVLGLSPESKIGDTVQFFIYDVVKIFFILYVMIAIIGFVRTYLPLDRLKIWLGGKHTFLGHFGASLFGAITPFCSCSSVPIFLSMRKASVPLGITLSFLVTSPILNEYLFVLMIGAFGLRIALLYAVGGILMGTLSGLVLGKMGLEKYLEQDLMDDAGALEDITQGSSIRERIAFGLKEAWDIVKKIWIWVVVGVGMGAVIHNYVPQETVQAIVGMGGPFTVIIATFLGVPMYGSCAAIVPIAVVLFGKGVPLGTALAFMMAIAALSLPEAVILRRAMHLKLIAIYFGVVTTAIIITGYVFNFIAAL
jgi:uncharacterized protein